MPIIAIKAAGPLALYALPPAPAQAAGSCTAQDGPARSRDATFLVCPGDNVHAVSVRSDRG